MDAIFYILQSKRGEIRVEINDTASMFVRIGDEIEYINGEKWKLVDIFERDIKIALKLEGKV